MYYHLKILEDEKLKDEFLYNVDFLSSNLHKNILKLIETESKTQMSYVQEYSRTTLCDFMKDQMSMSKSMSKSSILEIFAQICCALAFLH